MKISLKKIGILSIYCLTLFLYSCATAPAKPHQPDDQISHIKKIISLVKRYPQSQEIAGSELQHAENNLKLADQELKLGNSFRAKLHLDQAQSDAEYAKSKVRAATYKKLLEFKEMQLRQLQGLPQ